MKLLRTRRSHVSIEFGPDPDTDVADTDPDQVVKIDHAGVEVGGDGPLSDSDADTAITEAAKRGVELELVDVDEDAPATTFVGGPPRDQAEAQTGAPAETRTPATAQTGSSRPAVPANTGRSGSTDNPDKVI
jgi:hypothetical protein